VRALVCRRYGTPEDLELAELPDPAAGPGEILVGVRAAAANFADALVIANAYQVSVEPPFVPGSELAGEVLAVGAEVSDLKAGDLVFGTAFHGAFAERAVLPAGQVTKIPPGADFGEAAAFGVAKNCSRCSPPAASDRTSARGSRWPKRRPHSGT
jgi:NADPH2:quinone reductase